MFSNLNLNFYKYLPHLFNFVVFLKVVISWCAASSLIPGHLSFKTCSLRLVVSAHSSVMCPLFPSLNTENLPYPARFLRYIGFQIPSWKHANQFSFIQITSDCIQFPPPIIRSSAVHIISDKWFFISLHIHADIEDIQILFATVKIWPPVWHGVRDVLTPGLRLGTQIFLLWCWRGSVSGWFCGPHKNGTTASLRHDTIYCPR